MPLDLSRMRALAARADELEAMGYNASQIEAVLDQEQAQADARAQQYGHQSAAGARTTLQQQRSALNAESVSPGQEPDQDPIDRAFALAEQSGHQRGSDGKMQVFVEGLFEAAQAGDPRVVSQGTVTDETKRQWMADAHKRQISNREASGARHR